MTPAGSLALVEVCFGNGWHAGIAVHPDGTTWPWLFAPDGRPGERVRFPPHEMEGPLPAWIRHRVTRRACGAPTKAGHPCRIALADCRHHRQDPTAHDPTSNDPVERNSP